MAGLGIAEWTPRERPQQDIGREGRRRSSDGLHDRRKGSAEDARASKAASSRKKPSRRTSEESRPRGRATEPAEVLPTPPPYGEFREVGDGWLVSTISQDWLYKSTTGIYYHCPTETLWRKDQMGRGYKRVDPSAGAESVALVALGDTAIGQRAFLRACLLGWSRQRHKFDDMDKDLADGCANEKRLQRAPRISDPRAADRGDRALANLLEPAVFRFSNFVAGVSDGATSAFVAASASTAAVLANSVSLAANRERAGSPMSSRRSDDSIRTGSRSNSSDSTNSWKPKHAIPNFVVRRGPPDTSDSPKSSPVRSKTTPKTNAKTTSKSSGQYLGAVHLPPKRRR